MSTLFAGCVLFLVGWLSASRFAFVFFLGFLVTSEAIVLTESRLLGGFGVDLRFNQCLERGAFLLKLFDEPVLLSDESIAIVDNQILYVGHAVRLADIQKPENTNLKLTATFIKDASAQRSLH